MASMSYCMFENTETEMNQVVEEMQQANSWEDLDLNSYEDSAKEGLYELCQLYIKHFDRLSEELNKEMIKWD